MATSATTGDGEPTASGAARSRRLQAVVTGLLFAHVAVVGAVVAGVMTCSGCGKDPTEARMNLADATLTIDQADGVQHQLALTAGGEIRWDGKPVVTISRRGVVRDGKRVVAKVDKHGIMTIGGQMVDNLAVRPDGVLELDGEPGLTIDRDGVVGGPLIDSLDHPALVLEGSRLTYAGPPAARQALLLGFAAVISPSLAPAPVPAPPPTL